MRELRIRLPARMVDGIDCCAWQAHLLICGRLLQESYCELRELDRRQPRAISAEIFEVFKVCVTQGVQSFNLGGTLLAEELARDSDTSTKSK